MADLREFILVGGVGFIGSHLARHLQTNYPQAKIHIWDLRVEQEDETHRRIDVRKPLPPLGSFAPSTVIFNLAAIHKTPGHPDPDYFEANIRGAENICDFARRSNLKTIVFTSSIAPYGAADSPKSEDSLPMPNTPYGISKLVAEKIHQIWLAESSEHRLSIVRPGIVFGAREGGNFTRLYKALNRGMFAYAGRRDTRKAAIYVKDLVRVMTLMSENMTERFQLYNCCAPEPASIQEIVETMQRVIGKKRYVPMIPAWLLRKAASVLGLLDSLGLGFHPDRVKKLMVSTHVLGHRLHGSYTLNYTLESALADWWIDCDRRGLE